MVKVRVNARDHPSFGESTPGFSVLDPPACAFVSQFLFAPSEYHVLHGQLPQLISVHSYPLIVVGVERNVDPQTLIF